MITRTITPLARAVAHSARHHALARRGVFLLLTADEGDSQGDGNLLDQTTCVYVHKHAEANPHKCNSLAALLAGIADEILKAPLGKEFPTTEEKMTKLI